MDRNNSIEQHANETVAHRTNRGGVQQHRSRPRPDPARHEAPGTEAKSAGNTKNTQRQDGTKYETNEETTPQAIDKRDQERKPTGTMKERGNHNQTPVKDYPRRGERIPTKI